jgi:hypothetical protein
VFAGGDVVSGPGTVVDAIAAGKRAAVTIDRYLRGEPLRRPAELRLPEKYVEPLTAGAEEAPAGGRVEPPTLPVQARRRTFHEVEMAFGASEAVREATRCLRCDLAFTRPAKADKAEKAGTKELVHAGGAS